MTSRYAWLIVVAALGATPAFAAEEAAAPEKPGAEQTGGAIQPQPQAEPEKETDGGRRKARKLEEWIRPVSGHLFVKDGRFEISPGLGMSLGDAFFEKYTFGMKVNMHFTEFLSAGLHASYALNTASDNVVVCKDATCRNPGLDDLNEVPGNVGLIAGGEIGWTPFYGKLNLVAEKVLHFDLGATAGVSAIQYQAPPETTGGSPVSKTTVAGLLGIGQRYFLTRGMTLRLELRDYIYSAKITPLGQTNSKIENQIMFEVGLSFFAGKGSAE